MAFNLAPMQSRRDIAALGVIHRAILGLGPMQFRNWFQLDTSGRRFSRRLGRVHARQVVEPLLNREYLHRSIFGYTWVYNLLPEQIVQCSSVKTFQGACQDLLKHVASSGYQEWSSTFSARVSRNFSLLRHF